MQRYYPMRRIPDAFSSAYLWGHLTPLMPSLIGSTLWTTLAAAVPGKGHLKEGLKETARDKGDSAVEKAQRHFFDRPGLDTLVVRELTKFGKLLAQTGRAYLWLRLASGLDRDGRARYNLNLIPTRGYDALMLTGLAVGTALGHFRGGPVHSQKWWDSALHDSPNSQDSDSQQREHVDLPENHPMPSVRRFQAPRTLGDLAADIDDLYWAQAYGQSIKVTRVGDPENRRWLVSLPGTDHSTPESEPNAADLESNFREQLNLDSAMRLGTIQAIHKAMSADGVSWAERPNESVLLCGHSQGGMIAVALAALNPEELGFTVDAVLTMGAPTRRIRLRPSVAMIAIEHDQDIVPSLDGTPRKEPDQRVVLRRRLVRPRRGPLFYAHSSSTYTETLRQLERQEKIAPWGKAGQAFDRLSQFLPKPGEPTRVMHLYSWQDVLEPAKGKTWDKFLAIERPRWQPVEYGTEVEVAEEVPATPQELVGKAEAALQRWQHGTKENEAERAEDDSQ